MAAMPVVVVVLVTMALLAHDASPMEYSMQAFGNFNMEPGKHSEPINPADAQIHEAFDFKGAGFYFYDVGNYGSYFSGLYKKGSSRWGPPIGSSHDIKQVWYRGITGSTPDYWIFLFFYNLVESSQLNEEVSAAFRVKMEPSDHHETLKVSDLLEKYHSKLEAVPGESIYEMIDLTRNKFHIVKQG